MSDSNEELEKAVEILRNLLYFDIPLDMTVLELACKIQQQMQSLERENSSLKWKIEKLRDKIHSCSWDLSD